MCHINPEHLTLITSTGALLLGGGIVSFFTGHTYYRRIIARSDEPAMFWANVLGLLVLGGMMLVGVQVCPHY
jgi:uncharacterized membrane protein YhhN